MKRLVRGWISLFRFIVLGKDDGTFLKLDYRLGSIIAILSIIGLTRLVLENRFNTIYYFYNMKADIVLVMIAFVIFLTFFGSAALHLLLSVFGSGADYKKLFALVFNLQVLHLIIPFADFIGIYILGMPVAYQLLPASSVRYFVYYKAFLTPGILLAWVVTFVAVTRFLIRKQKMGVVRALAMEVIAFNLIFWPTYMLFPLFDASFDALVGIKCDDYFNISCFKGRVSFQEFWGFGLFFFVAGLSGMIHYFRHIRLPKEKGLQKRRTRLRTSSL